MEYNPLTARLRDAEKTLTALRRRRARALQEIAWATQFQPHVAELDLTRIKSELQTCATRLQRLDAKCAQGAATAKLLAEQTAELEDKARLGLNPGYWFSGSRSEAKERLRKHHERVRQHLEDVRAYSAQRDDAEKEVARLKTAISAKEQEIARFERFKLEAAQATIEEVDVELRLREVDLQRLEARKREVDRRLEAPLGQLAKCREETGQLQETIDELAQQQEKLAAKRRKADKLNRKISEAPNSYDRRLLHEESERRFGNGSPGRVVADVDHQVRALQSSIEYNERQMSRLGRDVVKIEARIKRIADIASRDMRLIIIDGKNLCFERNVFIGLAALIPLTDRLAPRYDVTVVFDASIRRDLAMSDEQLATALPAAKVHVVASREKADETILAAAHDCTAWVLSRDRFAEYMEKAPVKEGRVMRHEILHGRVMIHDLDLAVPLATNST